MRRHQRVAVRVAYLAGGSAAEAEDAAQEAFVKAFRALPRFRAGASFRPWLLAIVANEARNRRRSAGRRDRLAARMAAVEGEDRRWGDAAASPEGAVLAGEDRRALLGALSTLRQEDRLVIAYRYFLDLPEAETAAALGWPRGTVKSRLSRALGRLRETLQQGGDAGGGRGRAWLGGWSRGRTRTSSARCASWVGPFRSRRSGTWAGPSGRDFAGRGRRGPAWSGCRWVSGRPGRFDAPSCSRPRCWCSPRASPSPDASACRASGSSSRRRSPRSRPRSRRPRRRGARRRPYRVRPWASGTG